jgi:hypothetical protein
MLKFYSLHLKLTNQRLVICFDNLTINAYFLMSQLGSNVEVRVH